MSFAHYLIGGIGYGLAVILTIGAFVVWGCDNKVTLSGVLKIFTRAVVTAVVTRVILAGLP